MERSRSSNLSILYFEHANDVVWRNSPFLIACPLIDDNDQTVALSSHLCDQSLQLGPTSCDNAVHEVYEYPVRGKDLRRDRFDRSQGTEQKSDDRLGRESICKHVFMAKTRHIVGFSLRRVDAADKDRQFHNARSFPPNANGQQTVLRSAGSACSALHSGKPIVKLNPLNATKVTDVVRCKDKSILHGSGRNQNISIGDQMATNMATSIGTRRRGLGLNQLSFSAKH